MDGAPRRILAQDEVACNLHGNHRREDRSDDVEEARDVIHRIEGRRNRAEDGDTNADGTPRDAAHDALARDTRRVRVEVGGRDGGEDDDAEPRNTKPRVEHDLRDIRLTRENCRAHADEVHPAANQPVDNRTDGGRGDGLLRLARIVRDERQPRERHCNRQLECHRKAHRLARSGALRRARAAHEDGAEEHGEEEECRHRNGVHALDAQDANTNPYNNQSADYETPDPMRQLHHTARRERAVIDHDARPADELQHVQCRKEQPPARAERHLDRLHCTAPRPRTDQPCEKEQRTADDVTDNDCNAAVAKAERRKECACQNLRERDACTKPNERVRAESCPLFHDEPPCTIQVILCRCPPKRSRGGRLRNVNAKTRPCQ